MADLDLIKSKVDVVELIGQYIPLKKAGRNFKGNCPFHSEKTASFMVSPDKQIWHCFGCFPPGQQVKTPFGYHDIETLDENHFVYSGNSNIRQILATHKRQYHGDMVEVRVRKLGGVVSMTADHHLLVVRPITNVISRKAKQFYRQCHDIAIKTGISLSKAIERYAQISELSAGELRKDDFLLYPIRKTVSKIGHINFEDYLTKSYTYGPVPPKLDYNQPITDILLKMIGYYVAEGSTHRAYVRFSLGSHEEAFAQEIVEGFDQLFGLRAAIHRCRGSKTGLEITICHAHLANIFANLCGKGAANKHIPFVWQDLEPNQQKILVEAVLRGDGHVFTTNRSEKTHKSITTVSRILAEQVVDLLLRNNIFPSLYIEKAKIDKKKVNHKEAYSVFWSEEAKPQHNFVYENQEGGVYWLLPIKELKHHNYMGPVYNLTVEQDHSYVVGNFAVANCGKGGDVFRFLMEKEGLEFSEALAQLADKAGVQIQSQHSGEWGSKNILFNINDLAAKFYEKAMADSTQGRQALNYLVSRGLSREIAKAFRIGYAPTGWDYLIKFLERRGYKLEDIEKAGLAVQRSRGYSDKFHHRLMFPITNASGKVVGFTGRVLNAEDQPKYLNSPETPIFYKGRILYGLSATKEDIQKANYAVLVEGQMDLLSSYQAGVKNVVASSGTALTSEQLKLIRRYGEALVLALDADAAGGEATKRAIELAATEDLNIKVAILGEFKDPDDCIKAGVDVWNKIVEGAIPVIDFYLDHSIKKFGIDTVAGKKKVAVEVLSVIGLLSDPVEKDQYIKKLANRLATSADSLYEAMGKLKAPHSAVKAEEKSVVPDKDPDWLSKRVLGIILYRADYYPDFRDRLNQTNWQGWSERVYSKLTNCYTGSEFSLDGLLSNLAYDDRVTLLELLMVIEEQYAQMEEADIRGELNFYINLIQRRQVKQTLARLKAEVSAAEQAGDQEKLSILLEQFKHL